MASTCFWKEDKSILRLLFFSVGFCKKKIRQKPYMYPNRYQYHDSFLQGKKKVVVLDKNEDTLLRGTSLDLLGRLCELAGEHQQE